MGLTIGPGDFALNVRAYFSQSCVRLSTRRWRTLSAGMDMVYWYDVVA